MGMIALCLGNATLHACQGHFVLTDEQFRQGVIIDDLWHGKFYDPIHCISVFLWQTKLPPRGLSQCRLYLYSVLVLFINAWLVYGV